MTHEIKKVVVAGATGNLGPAIVEGLVNAGFEVTVLTRPTSQRKPAENVKAVAVDYDSVDDLGAALRGQDAVVSTLGSHALSKQLLLVEAAAKAGVKQFLPSEFGSNTVHPPTGQLAVFHDKILVQEALRKEASKPTGMTYTILCNGPFLDWGIKVGFILDVKNKKVTLYDGGDQKVSFTTLPTIGRAVAAVLKKPEEAENRAVYVHDIAISSKDLLAMGKKAVGPDGWVENHASTKYNFAEAMEELKKPSPHPEKVYFNLLSVAVWGEDAGALFDKPDNDILGLGQLTETDVQAIVDGISKAQWGDGGIQPWRQDSLSQRMTR